MTDIEKRMHELMVPIDNCIQLTDDENELLMLACAMMQRTREIFDDTIGERGRKQMFKEMI
jgi:hypothetical protein